MAVRKSKVSKTFTINGVKSKFEPKNCFFSSSEASYEAEKIRKNGRYARVVKSGEKLCVYVSVKKRKK